MRILHVADLHYALPQLDWVVAAAPAYDLVVMAGDQLNIASSVPLTTQITVIHNYLARIQERSRLVICSGNHDLTGPDRNGEQAALWLAAARDAGIPTDHDSLTIDGTLVTICPWWDGPIGRSDVSAQLKADAARRPARWIWVYHWPPTGSPTTWIGSRYYGDDDVGGWIDEHRPDFVLTGHVHQPPFKPEGSWADRIGPTWVFNPGNQRGPTPAHISIDLDEGTAAWSSLMGREETDLSAAQAPARSVF